MTQVWDVVIVGCGPIGAYAGNLLAKAGLRTLILDRATSPYALPRAVHIDHEMIRLLADIGLREGMLGKMRAGDGHIHVGADHGVIRYLSVAGQPRPYGYANDYFLYQPEFEQDLRGGLTRFANVELRLGAEVIALEQDDGLATIALAGGEQVQARWVLGCDGARSTVRRASGIKLDDLDFDEPWLVVDAEVDGPISFPDFAYVPPEANLQNLSLMMCDPQRPATIVPGRGNHRRWEFMLLPGEDDSVMSSPHVVTELVKPWVADSPHKIIRAATYHFHGLVAEDWRKGRVFLVGDSAHQTPPFFGQGMCHGLRDAANLAWKLALVVAGRADPALLDTYQPEREGQVRHVINAAVDAGRYICELDPQKAAQRDVAMRAQKGIRSASELIAPIASPIVLTGGGERFINPEIEAARLFDDVSGGGWVLLETAQHPLGEAASQVAEVLGTRRLRLGAALADHHGFIADWFAKRQACAVLLRPDFYVALVAQSPSQLDAQLVDLGQQLRLTRTLALAH